MPRVHIATYQREIYNGISVATHLKNDLPPFAEDVVIRLGGTKPYADYKIQINSAEAVMNSVNKLRQKELLLNAGLQTLPMLKEPVFPCVLKAVFRSGGTSVHVVNNREEFDAIVASMQGNYIIEPLFKATGEYRLHCTQNEVFFQVKKHKRNPQDIIINRDNHYNKMDFIRPRLWKQMEAECIRAMRVLNLDIACFDVMYDSSDNNQHRFTISEANTNPELLLNTYNAYLAKLTELINAKIGKRLSIMDNLWQCEFTRDDLFLAMKQVHNGGLISDEAVKAIIKILK